MNVCLFLQEDASWLYLLPLTPSSSPPPLEIKHFSSCLRRPTPSPPSFLFALLTDFPEVMRRFVYCKVVLTTSLVWVLVDVFLLLYFSECNRCDERKDHSLLPALRGEFTTLFAPFRFRQNCRRRTVFGQVWEWINQVWLVCHPFLYW